MVLKSSLSLVLAVASLFDVARPWTVPNAAVTGSQSRGAVIRPRRDLTRYLSSDSNDVKQKEGGPSALEEAALLRERAETAREEALGLERNLAEERVRSIEAMLEDEEGGKSGAAALSVDERRTLSGTLKSLREFLDPPRRVADADEGCADVEGEGGDVESKDASEIPEEEEEDEEEPQEMVGTISEEDLSTVEELYDFLLELSLLDTFTQGIESELLDIDDENKTASEYLTEWMEEIRAGNVTQDKLDEALDYAKLGKIVVSIPGFSKIKDKLINFARVMNVTNGPNWIDDQELSVRVRNLENFLPSSTTALSSSTKGWRLNQTDVDELASLITSECSDVFEVSARPLDSIYGYVIGGRSVAPDGDTLLSRIDSVLDNNKFIVYYIRDINSVFLDNDSVAIVDAMTADIDDQSDSALDKITKMAKNFDELEPTSLLVLPKDLRPEPAMWEVRGAVSAVAMYLVLSFVGRCYGGDGFVAGLTADPSIILSLLALSTTHQLGHYVTAALNGVELALPNLAPSMDGLLTTNGPVFLTPPKNNKALFDVAFAGPALGFAVSWSTLIYGLVLTSKVVNSEEASALPHVAFDFLRLSSLTSATVETFLGTDTLLSIDPVAEVGLVAVHPLVVAGHLGVMASALALLPADSTSDGSRMIRGAFSRSSVVEFVSPFLSLFLIIQSIRDWGVSSMLVVYLFTRGWFEDDRDLPCRNDVDPAGGLRVAVCFASLLVAAITISPSF